MVSNENMDNMNQLGQDRGNQTVAQGHVQNNPILGNSNAVATPVVWPQSPLVYAEKPKKFNGSNFKRWQMKMQFFLTTLGLTQFLSDDSLIQRENDPEYLVALRPIWLVCVQNCRTEKLS